MLELRPTCEHCNKALPPESTEAMICTFECTFCKDCVGSILENVCRNCGGWLLVTSNKTSEESQGRQLLGQISRQCEGQASAGGRCGPQRIRREHQEHPTRAKIGKSMNVILFGASGMVGQGVLRECLLDHEVERVLSIVRKATGQTHEKLAEVVHADFANYSGIEQLLAGYSACFFCLGVSSAGMSEADYHHVTYDFTIAAAEVLAKLNPEMTFVYVTGTGTDSTEQGKVMWARVKGKTENALLRLPFKAAYMFRPAMIQPLHGITSRTALYRVLYSALGFLFPLFYLLFPKQVSTTEIVGRAMLEVAKRGAPKRILETVDINALVAASS